MSAFPLPPSALPTVLGYRMPAEWEPHAATWLSWPHKRESWPGKFEPIPPLWARLIRTLAQFEPVNVLAGGEAVMEEASAWSAMCRMFACTTSRPTTPGLAIMAPRFSSARRIRRRRWWIGATTPGAANIRRLIWTMHVPQQIAELTGRRRFTPGIILEGGAIDPNGLGTILTTEQCLLNPNRNPHLNPHDIERYLADYLGAKKSSGSARESKGTTPTATSTNWPASSARRTVVAPLEENADDLNYRPLRENFERLKQMTDQEGRPLEVIPLPMPRPIYHDGQRLPASYCNFYIANGVVIVPQFDDPADRTAVEMLGRQFPQPQIIGLPARDLVWGLGAFHCITQQEPALP